MQWSQCRSYVLCCAVWARGWSKITWSERASAWGQPVSPSQTLLPEVLASSARDQQSSPARGKQNRPHFHTADSHSEVKARRQIIFVHSWDGADPGNTWSAGAKETSTSFQQIHKGSRNVWEWSIPWTPQREPWAGGQGTIQVQQLTVQKNWPEGV